MRALLVAAVLALPVAGVATTAAPASPGTGPTPCPRLQGPPIRQAGHLLDHYVIGAHGGISCATARRWVGAILRESTADGSLAKPRGPAGWVCLARARGHIAFNGSCRKGARSFSWGAV